MDCGYKHPNVDSLEVTATKLFLYVYKYLVKYFFKNMPHNFLYAIIHVQGNYLNDNVTHFRRQLDQNSFLLMNRKIIQNL